MITRRNKFFYYLYLNMKKNNISVTTLTGKTKIKIVFLGNQGVGKTSIIQRYVHERFQQTSNPTVGIDFLAKNVVHKEKLYRLQLWDTAGQQRFRSLIPNYLKDAQCALIIFDVSNPNSLNNAEMWLKLYSDNKTVNGFTFLIGNKIDLQYRQISSEQGIKKAKELGLQYFQISAKTGQNVEHLFSNLIDVSNEMSLSAGNFSLDQPRILKHQKIIEQQREKDEDDINAPINQSVKKLVVQQISQKPEKSSPVKQDNINESSKIILNKKTGAVIRKEQNCC